MEPRRDSPQKKSRNEKDLVSKAADFLSNRENSLSFADKFPLDISPLRMHLGGQLGLVCSFAVALISLIWTYQRGDATSLFLSNRAAQLSFACALIAGGATYCRRLEGGWAWLMTLGLLGQDAICSLMFAQTAQNSVALLWMLGASALLLFTYSRHLPLALLGILNFYASAELLATNLPLSGALCLFLLWSSFFSFISVMLKCRALSWAGLYLAPFFFHRVYCTVLIRAGMQMTPAYLWLLIAMQLVQITLFGTSVAGYTGSYRQPLSPKQTWWYFPISLFIFFTYSAQFGQFGIWQRLIFDSLCLLIISAGFIGVAAYLLRAPLSDLTMVHALSAVVALDIASQSMQWYAAHHLNLGAHASDFSLIAEISAGALCTLILGICARLYGVNLHIWWRRTECRMAILVTSGFGLLGMYRLLFDQFDSPNAMSAFVIALNASVYGVGLHLIFQRASSSWYQIANSWAKCAIGLLFILQCASWSVVAQALILLPPIRGLPPFGN